MLDESHDDLEIQKEKLKYLNFENFNQTTLFADEKFSMMWVKSITRASDRFSLMKIETKYIKSRNDRFVV